MDAIMRMHKFVFLAVGVAFALSACGSSEPAKRPAATKNRSAAAGPQVVTPSPRVNSSARPHYKVGRPYVIGGNTHVPKERFDLAETGRASWYGPGFHGRQTANGEQYDKRAFTAAHRTLQLPAIIRVTNIGNGRSVVLRVNDRGPYHDGRILDVSEAGAEALDFKHLGTALVRVEVLDRPSRRVAGMAGRNASVAELESVRAEAAATEGGVALASQGQSNSRTGAPAQEIYVQAASFSSVANARAFLREAAQIGNAEIVPAFVSDRRIYRVKLGPFASINAAERTIPKLARIGAPSAHVTVVQ